jgi:uncharacterized membrane protein
MKRKLLQELEALKQQVSPNSSLLFLILIAIALGVFFRLINIAQKPFWFDEVFTAMQASGYAERDIFSAFTDGQIHSSTYLHQYLTPALDGSPLDTIRSFATENPQHTPLYFLLTRFIFEWFGSSVTSARSLPVIFGLLSLPCMYWLAKELFESSLIAGLATALLSISPIFLLYSQEARPSSLFIFLVLLSSVSLLVAIRIQKWQIWLFYGITLVLSFYSFTPSLLVALGHGLYILISDRWKITKTFKPYIITSLLSLLAFIPWILIFLNNFNQVESTSFLEYEKVSSLQTLSERYREIRSVFLDFNLGFKDSTLLRTFSNLFALLSPVFLGWSFYHLYRLPSRKPFIFITTLGLPTFLVFTGLDIFKGGILPVTQRYFFPTYLALLLAVAALLSLALPGSEHNKFEKLTRQIVQGLVAVVFSVGVLSCTMVASADTWWTKGLPDVAIATKAINKADKPLLISDSYLATILSLSYGLNSKTDFLIYPKCYNCSSQQQKVVNNQKYYSKIPQNYQSIYIYTDNDVKKVLRNFENGNEYKPIPVMYKGKRIETRKKIRCWQLKPI